MLRPVPIFHGSDPEFFIERDGAVIGSERLIPEGGLRSTPYAAPSIVQDGVQIELNPIAQPSLPAFGLQVSGAFRALKEHLHANPSIRCCWRGVVEVSRTELDMLSPKSRVLGCQPSANIYGDFPITVDPVTYQKRSAGGHLHLGLTALDRIWGREEDERGQLVPFLDVFVGNTCVMLDRDPLAAERRENYGRAGEHRLPKHGLEYRTLSNFWLRNYSLMSLVFGMANVAVSVVNHTLTMREDLTQELIDVVDIQKVRKAIDTNDFDLAKENFNVIRPFLAKHLPEAGYPLNPGTLDKFLTFADYVKDRGLEFFFPQDPMTHWVSGKQVEFASFVKSIY